MMLKPHAEKAAAELQINPDVLIAQVALETGWGKHVIHDKQGGNSFNLFNIKAGSQWQGDKVNVATLEYRDGIAANEKADFRKYTDYADSFSDYVRLMKNNSRYEQVLQKGGDSAAYAEALQSAGYATDPEYAQKIKRLLNSDVIKSLGALNPIDDLKSNVQSVLSLATDTRRQLVE
jgi:flagellar protein FlgJ